MVGIKDLKEATAAVAELGLGVGMNIKDGEFDWSAYIPFIAALAAAVEGMENIPAQVADIDEMEAQEILEDFLNRLQPLEIIDPDIGQSGIEAAVALVIFIKKVVVVAQAIKAKKSE